VCLGPDIVAVAGQPAYFEELKSEMAELYGDLAEEVSWDDYSIYPRPVD
jgi:hypothetical protein